MTVVGVDGCRGGWIAAIVDGRSVRWQVETSITAILERWPQQVVAIDMPIGLVTANERAADLAAKAWLREHGGPPASIFMTPNARIVADFREGLTHAETMVRARERGEPGTSIQAWNLLPKIIELETALARHTARVVVEAHPEISFRRLDPRVAAPKKTARGAGQRIRALSPLIEVVDVFDALSAAHGSPAEPAMDDALDALAVAWTASRVARGIAFALPADSADGTRIAV